jgi:hypothetical protein
MDKRRQQQAAAQKVVAYRSMLDIHPQLKRHDPTEINRIYNSLHNANPGMAKDPMVAGAWVDQIMQSKELGHTSHQALLAAVKDLSGIRSQSAQAMRFESEGRGRLPDYLTKAVEQAGQHAEVLAIKGVHAQADKREAELNERHEQLFGATERKIQEAQRMAEKAMDQQEARIDAKHKAERAALDKQKAELQSWAQELHGTKTSSDASAPTTSPRELKSLFAALGI